MRSRHILLLVASACVLHACRKEPVADAGNGFTGPVRHAFAVGAPLTIDVRGQVLDEAGVPVSGALVMAGYGSQTATTDQHGAFALNGIRAYQRLGFVKVSKTGYFLGSRSFVPVPGANVVRIHLLARNLAGTVQAATGGEVELEGTRIRFGTGGFTRYGQPYSGPVNVFLNHIDPVGTNLQYEMPGSLVGAKAGEPMPLVTFGMVAVELTDASGTKVELAPGATARVRAPMAAAQLASAEQSIDLWHFNEALGYWTFEGAGQLVDGQYEAEVSHFSIWNFDVPNSGCSIQGQLTDAQGSPLQGAAVRFFDATGERTFWTSTTGHFGGMVRRGVDLTMSVSIACGGTTSVVHTQPAGPYPGDTELPAIAIDLPGLSTLTGTVANCQGLPAANAYVLINGQPIFCANGQFSFITCAGSATIEAADLASLSYGDPLTVQLSGGDVDLGLMQACDVVVATGSVTDVDANTYPTISFLGQEWMATNLRTSKYRNGDPIPNLQNAAQWQSTASGAWRHYDDDPAHEPGYGKLYNFYTVSDPRNVCPSGWHVPTQAEWDGLVNLLGGPEVAGGKLKEVGLAHWQAPNYGATNLIGFTARPGGAHFSNGSAGMGVEANFWTSEPNDLNFSHMRMMHRDSAHVYVGQQYKNVGMSIRCKRD